MSKSHHREFEKTYHEARNCLGLTRGINAGLVTIILVLTAVAAILVGRNVVYPPSGPQGTPVASLTPILLITMETPIATVAPTLNPTEMPTSMQNKEIELITISGINKETTIDDLNKVVNLVVSGIDNKVRLTKYTEISKITLSGVRNTITLCKDIHNPAISESGIDTKINYVSC